jgi:hypothetical protein
MHARDIDDVQAAKHRVWRSNKLSRASRHESEKRRHSARLISRTTSCRRRADYQDVVGVELLAFE